MFKTKNNLKKTKNVLFCAAEVAPLAKVGGLADVTGSLPAALKKQGLDVRVIMPAHSVISLRAWKAVKIKSFSFVVDGKKEIVNLYQVKIKNITYYLLQNKNYFTGNVYEGDSIRKYLFFCRAVIEALPELPFHPDIIHAHDFHASAIIIALSVIPRDLRSGLVLTIHNLQHQGWVDKDSLIAFGFDSTQFPKSAKSKTNDSWFNILAAAIARADKITTVSPNYAKEIMTSAYGQDLEKLLGSRRQDLVGIINGLDLDAYNPAKDKFLAQNYNQVNLKSGKQKNKEAVRAYVNLEPVAAPLFVLIARLSDQKGVDLFTAKNLQTLSAKYPFQLIILGTGEAKYEKLAKSLEKALPESVRAIIAFDNVLAHGLYAAADYFLVPSRFEPCGLTQMMAMRYGSVPIVRATGGLKDTVINGKTGLVFKDYSTSALNKSLEKALRLYYKDQNKYQLIQKAGLKKDWSWDNSAKEYKKLYLGF